MISNEMLRLCLSTCYKCYLFVFLLDIAHHKLLHCHVFEAISHQIFGKSKHNCGFPLETLNKYRTFCQNDRNLETE